LGFDFEAGFFADFALDGLGEMLAGFDDAAGEGPPSSKGLFATLDEEDAVAIDDERADAEEGALGVTARVANTAPSLSRSCGRGRRRCRP
jgi:hypothetical protein